MKHTHSLIYLLPKSKELISLTALVSIFDNLLLILWHWTHQITDECQRSTHKFLEQFCYGIIRFPAGNEGNDENNAQIKGQFHYHETKIMNFSQGFTAAKASAVQFVIINIKWPNKHITRVKPNYVWPWFKDNLRSTFIELSCYGNNVSYTNSLSEGTIFEVEAWITLLSRKVTDTNLVEVWTGVDSESIELNSTRIHSLRVQLVDFTQKYWEISYRKHSGKRKFSFQLHFGRFVSIFLYFSYVNRDVKHWIHLRLGMSTTFRTVKIISVR